MGKMIDAQSIVVASTATQWYGHEGDILRYVFWHSIALASLVRHFRLSHGLRISVHTGPIAMKMPRKAGGSMKGMMYECRL